MDSCHLFNFLFGTKKATSELSRCFSQYSGSSRAADRDSCPRAPPPSPLKQLQRRIVSSFAASSSASAKSRSSAKTEQLEPRVQDVGAATDCGTYRATLVESVGLDDDEDDDQETQSVMQQDNGARDSAPAEPECRCPDQLGPRQVVLYERAAGDQVVTNSAQVYELVAGEPADSAAPSRLVGWRSSSVDTDREPPAASDKRGAYVRNIVQSFETSSQTSIETVEMVAPSRMRSRAQFARGNTVDGCTPSKLQLRPLDLNNNISNNLAAKPTTIVKPLPPKSPPRSRRAELLGRLVASANARPTRIEQLVQDEHFLARLFGHLEPLDRCVAAQVCRKWRQVLYADQRYWKELVSVIDCTQLRRELLLECIMSTLQSAKLKQQTRQHQQHQRLAANRQPSAGTVTHSESATSGILTRASQLSELDSSEHTLDQLDQDDVWRIQELCNRFAHRNAPPGQSSRACQYQIPNCPPVPPAQPESQQQALEPLVTCQASKSSSIPSQISSTFSSVSLSSLLSPLSESSRVEFIKEKLYNSLDERGFDALCLFGATDEDIEDLIGKMPHGAHSRIQIGRLNNCCITDRGLELFVAAFSQLVELELSGCNEITNAIELRKLAKLRSLILTDCINIADGFAQQLAQVADQLEGLTIQAYHLTDAFVEYLSLNADTSGLKRLELPDCKEITNQSLMVIAKHLSHLEALSLSGSTKVCDDGIEVLAEQATHLRSLDLSWCTKITDAALECIACDLGATLTDLILDRNVHITDSGLSFLTTMSRLTLLHIRWCPRITDVGLECVLPIRTLRYLSIAGLQQPTARSLLCLVETDLLEVELTNCQAVNRELLQFLSARMPRCKVIF